jgi:hypothetical protein
MSEIKREKIQLRVAVVLGFELCLVLVLFFLLQQQSSTVGLAAEEQSSLVHNLVTNPSFEPPTSTVKCDGGPAPVGWGCTGWQGGRAALRWDSSGGSSGVPTDTHSVLIIGHDEGARAAWSTASSHLFPIDAGQQYSFAGWIRADYMYGSARAYLELEFLDGHDKALGRSMSDPIVDPAADWVHVRGSGVPPTGTVKGRLSAKLEGQGVVGFDNVIVSDSSLVPFLSLDVEGYPDPVSPTGTLTYVVTLSNTGGYTVRSIRLTGTYESRLELLYRDPISDELEPGKGLSALHVCAVNVLTDAHVPLSSTFEVSADDVETTRIVVTTLISPSISFELPPCSDGFGVPGVPLDYLLRLTNTSNLPISFSFPPPIVIPEDCGDATVYPKYTDSISPLETNPVTLTFTPTIAPPNHCIAMLLARAPNGAEKAVLCGTYVISDPLDLKVVDAPDPVGAGEELTYTLSYTYAGGIDTANLRITVSLGYSPNNIVFDPQPDIVVSDRTYAWWPPTKPTGGTGTIMVVAGVPATSTGFVTSTAKIGTPDQEPVIRLIRTSIREYEIYLPIILRSWPPHPPSPDLYSIENEEIDGSYVVSWSGVSGATDYKLYEAPDACTDWRLIYSGPSTSYAVDGKSPGHYCYYVAACRGLACSLPSDVQIVGAWWEQEDNDTCWFANGPLIFGHEYYGRHDRDSDQYPTEGWDCFWIDLQNDGPVSSRLTTNETEDLQLMLLDQNCAPVGPPDDLCFDSAPPYELGGTKCTAGRGRNFVCIHTMRASVGEEHYSLEVLFPQAQVE